jgi:hypothetical protein
MTATTSFTCNICGEESTRICARCTKDTCNNHLCEKCLRCSDCCECEITRDESVRPVVRPSADETAPQPEPHPDPALLVAEEGALTPPDSPGAREPECPPPVPPLPETDPTPET